MAKMTETGFSGRVGPVVHYNLNGKNIVRSLPGPYKQTTATKARAGEFGQSSRIAKSIRIQLKPIIPNPKDIKMQTRLVSAVFEWIRSMKGNYKKGPARPIERFNFHEKSKPGVLQRGFPEIQVSNPSPGMVQIKIPSFIPNARIKAPAHTQYILCKISTGVTDLKNNRSRGRASVELEIEYNDKEISEQTISFKLRTPENALIVTGVSLTYQINRTGDIRENTNKNFMPVEIVSAVCL